MKTTVWKRLASLSLTAAMVLGLCAGFGAAPAIAADGGGSNSKGINVIINNPRNASVEDLDKAISDALVAMGISSKKVTQFMKDLDLDISITTVDDDDDGGTADDDTQELDLPTADLSSWVVADHYDSGYYYTAGTNNAGNINSNSWNTNNMGNYRYNPTYINNNALMTGINWLNIFGATGANFNYMNTTAPNDSLRPYYPHKQTVSAGTGNGNINDRKLATWVLNPDKYYNATNDPEATSVGSFDRHTYSRLVKEGDRITETTGPDGKTRMDFVGYYNSRYFDYLFYPMDTDPTMTNYQFKDKDGNNLGKPTNLKGADKLVKFDVFGGQVNPHSLYGAGFLVNTGIDASGFISGYVLLYVYPEISASTYKITGKYYPPQLALYKLKSGLTAQEFHDYLQGSTTGPAGTIPTANVTTPATNPGNSGPVLSALFTGNPIVTVPLYTDNTEINNRISAGNTNWWMDMHINLVIKPDRLIVYQNPLADKTNGTITYGVDKLPVGMNEVMNVNLETTAGAGILPYNGFGPVVSYRSHSCNRATQFTYFDLVMSIIGGAKPEYEITYDLNGGTISPPLAPQTKQHDIDLILHSAEPTRAEYDFVGWNPVKTPKTPADKNQGADNGVVVYTAGGTEKGTYKVNKNATLYAVWKPKPKNLLYDALIQYDDDGLFKGNCINFVIDLTDPYKPDRTNASDGNFALAVDWMLNGDYDVKYITDTNNVILTDGAGGASGSVPGAPMTARDQGVTVGPNRWDDIAAYIASFIPLCIDGINYFADEVIAYGSNFKDAEKERDEAYTAKFKTEFTVAVSAHYAALLASTDPDDEELKEKIRNLLVEIPGAANPLELNADPLDTLRRSKLPAAEEAVIKAAITAADTEAKKAGQDAYENKKKDYVLEDSGFEINLTQETFWADPSYNYVVAAYSIDGGKKWKNIKAGKNIFTTDPAETRNRTAFTKLFNKDMKLALSDKPIYGTVNKASEKDKALKKAKQPAPGYQKVTFPEIKKRPKDATKYGVNYGIYPDNTGLTKGQWAISGKPEIKKFSVDLKVTDALKDKDAKKYLVARGNMDNGKLDKVNPIYPYPFGDDNYNYGYFCQEDGIPVKVLPDTNKVLKSVYFIKTGAVDNSPPLKDSAGNIVKHPITDEPVSSLIGPYTASSKLKKISASSEIKAPKVKPKAKDAKVNVKNPAKDKYAVFTVKLKKGDLMYAGGKETLETVEGIECVTVTKAEDAIKALADGKVIYVNSPKGLVVSLLEDDKTAKTQKMALTATSITVWKAAIGKKPASAKTTVDLTPPALLGT
ncbi:MAG: InlB B-repeat-containing protein [Oscillospiraceae bacterium]|jgi:hypothetical protein|nr:InlB B-repeat-containing protein [Oscillospiraceae bacterium]